MNDKWLVGIDLGGTTTKLAFLSTSGELIQRWEIHTDNREGGKYITPNIANSIKHTLEELGTTRERLLGVGMGAPGPVDYKLGVMYNTVNLGWEDHYPLKERLEDALYLPAYIDNDANCAALGEMWKGAGAGAKDLVCVTIGTGVGGGVITNGRIVQGKGGAAGEIGHITSIAEGGTPCNCGKTGCLETVASATGIVRLAMNKLEDKGGENSILKRQLDANGKIEAKDVLDGAKEGDSLCLEVVNEVSFHLGLALANIGNTLNPEKIVIGGGVSKAGPFLLQHIQSHFERFAFPNVKESTHLSLATLGNHAGVIGAGWLVAQELLNT